MPDNLSTRSADCQALSPNGNFDRVTSLARRVFDAKAALLFDVTLRPDIISAAFEDGAGPSNDLGSDDLADTIARAGIVDEPCCSGDTWLAVSVYAGSGRRLGVLVVSDANKRVWTHNETLLLTELGRSIAGHADLNQETTARQQAEIAVAECTSDLQDAREAAEAARRARDALLVDVNHELRAPLQAIVGFTEFLKTETRPEVVRAHAQTIQGASQSLLVLVNQLLDWAGAEGAVTVDRSPTALETLATTCLSMVAPLALEKHIGSHLVIDPDVPGTVLADGPKIQQVLVNLLNNAIKFTNVGSVTLRISYEADRVRFSVTDTGIGIPDDKLPKLFQRFSRIEPENLDMRGTGLGLAIAKRLVELMGGTIDVQSDIDRGTTFVFEIAAQETNPNRTEASLRRWEPAQPTGARILIADDLDLNRKLIADMLSTEGHEIDCVSDGAEAVRAAGSQSYDLILMDMIMPVMDGLSATRAIRALPAPACDVAIIALTAHSFKEQLDSCLAAGMNATITKPMSLDTLTATVRDWTRGRTRAA